MKNINFCLDYEYSGTCREYGEEYITSRTDRTIRRHTELLHSNYHKKTWGFSPRSNKYSIILYACVELYQESNSMASLKNFRDFRHKWGLVI